MVAVLRGCRIVGDMSRETWPLGSADRYSKARCRQPIVYGTGRDKHQSCNLASQRKFARAFT